ncbi:MAG: 3-hydroxyacyl-CoA dehydrogenase family protein [Halanaeroarchaeum sp.]
MRVAVLGAGQMGHGIAQVSAQADHDVVLRDVEESIVDAGIESIAENLQGAVDRDLLSSDEREATLGRIDGTTDLSAAVTDADLVIEAVPEDLDLKTEVFGSVDGLAPDDAILASNTSSLPVSEIANALDRPDRFVGLHFFNPVHLMDLVEIVRAEQTSDATASFAVDFVEDIGKEPIVVADSAGFATSRLGVITGLEAIRMVEAGVASPPDIDAGMVVGYNYPIGPLELTDVVGLDVRLDVAEHLRSELGERFRPPQLLRRKVRAGKLGKKTGEGFYVWEDGERVGPSGDWD